MLRPLTGTRHVAVLLLLLVVPRGLRAQSAAPERLPEPPTWTLGELERIGLETNPTLRLAQLAVEAAEGRAFQAGRRPNPSVGYTAVEVGNEGRAGQHGFGFSQQLLQREKLAWRVNAADAETLRLQQAWAVQEQRVLNDVRAALYETLYAQTYVELALQLVDLGRKNVEIAEARYVGMETGRADYLQAKVALSQTNLQLVEGQNLLDGAWRRLLAVVGLPDLKRRRLEGDLTAGLHDVNWDDALARLSASSPEIATAVAEIERAHAAVHREIANARPSPTVQAGVGYDEATGDMFMWGQYMIPFRIHDKRTGAIRAAQADSVAAQQELERVELQLRHRLATSFQRYRTVRRRFEVHDKEIVPTARESYDLVRHGYEADEYNYVALLNAQRTYVRSSLERLDALRELRKLTVMIDGMLLTGALQAQMP